VTPSGRAPPSFCEEREYGDSEFRWIERPGDIDQRLNRVAWVEGRLTGRYHFEWGEEEGRGELENEEEDEQSRMIDCAYRQHISPFSTSAMTNSPSGMVPTNIYLIDLAMTVTQNT
jgi:hypothetical protein